MTHDELLWAINSVVESGPCETVGHYSSAKALRAVVELHKPQEITLPNGEWGTNCGHCDIGLTHPCPTIQAIEEHLK